MSTPASQTADTVRDIIVAHPFFKDLNPHYVHLLAECASFERFAIGQDIFLEGQQADRFYLIHKSRLSLETFVPRTGATTLHTVNAGDALGWSWLYPPYQWQFKGGIRGVVSLLTTSTPVRTIGRSIRKTINQ